MVWVTRRGGRGPRDWAQAAPHCGFIFSARPFTGTLLYPAVPVEAGTKVRGVSAKQVRLSALFPRSQGEQACPCSQLGGLGPCGNTLGSGGSPGWPGVGWPFFESLACRKWGGGGSDRAGEGVSLPGKGRRQQGESLCGKEACWPLLHGDERQAIAFLPSCDHCPQAHTVFI